jgi:hypothetical protein
MKKYTYCLLLFLFGCGGNGGGGGGRIDDDVIILPTYGYQISASPAGGLLMVTVPGEGGMRTISIDLGNTLNGEVNVSVDFNDIATVTDYSLQSLSTLTVNSDIGIQFLGTFSVEVIEDMLFEVGDPPTTGMIEVVMGNETVTLEVFVGGVELRLAGGLPIALTWDELELLLDDNAAFSWQRRAALAAEVLEFVFVQALTVTEVLNLVTDELASINPLVGTCDAFTGAPPAGVLAQGEERFTWMGSGNFPMGGDDFQWLFTDCWVDDANDTEDQLINGSIDLNNYIEIIDGQFNLVGTGFDEVIFNNITIARTDENPPGTFTIDPANTITVSGGFDLAFIGFTN